jgi:hypothetical protein
MKDLTVLALIFISIVLLVLVIHVWLAGISQANPVPLIYYDEGATASYDISEVSSTTPPYLMTYIGPTFAPTPTLAPKPTMVTRADGRGKS